MNTAPFSQSARNLIALVCRFARRLLGGSRFRPRVEADPALDQFARMLRGVRAPAEVRAALVYLSQRLSGAERVELELDEVPGRPPRVVARWPRQEAEAGTVEPPAGLVSAAALAPVTLALQFDGKLRGRLRLVPKPGQRWSEGVTRRLETLCVLAAAAELRSARLDDESATRDPVTGTRNAAYLGAFLTHVLARARRRIEPVSLLAVELVDLPALRQNQGDELAAAALARAARAMTGTLRAGDLIARLDDEHLVAVLTGCAAADAVRVAEVVRQAITEAEHASGLEPPPSAVVGVANYPEHALEPGPLLSAALEAVARAKSHGQPRVAAAPRLRPNPAPSLVLHRVG